MATKKPRPTNYEPKVKTDKTFLELIKMAVNPKSKDGDEKKRLDTGGSKK